MNAPNNTQDAMAAFSPAHGSANTWPGGRRHAMHQDAHERWNASHYPGTRQVCSKCGEATGRCEEDAMWSDDGEPFCETCYSPNESYEIVGNIFENPELLQA